MSTLTARLGRWPFAEAFGTNVAVQEPVRRSVLAVALASIACSPPEANVAVAVSPNPVLITGFNFGHGRIVDQAEWHVSVTETAGLGFVIESVSGVAVDVATGAPVGEVSTLDFAADVGAQESITIQQRWAVPRDFDDPFRPRRFEVTLRFQDDKGNRGERKVVAPAVYQ